MSDDPADALIRELIATRRAATPGEVARILDRMASAPFFTDDSLASHAVRRALDGQWRTGTTAGEFRADARTCALNAARLGVYRRRGGAMAGVVAATDRVVPAVRRGPNREPWCFAVYSADRGKLITAYQFTNTTQLALPADIQWLM